MSDCGWGLVVVVLGLSSLALLLLSILSINCFLQSWTDHHHWWPNSAVTNYLDDPSCPHNFLSDFFPELSVDLYLDGWINTRLFLFFLFIGTLILGSTTLGSFVSKIRARLREQRLEAKYPWLASMDRTVEDGGTYPSYVDRKDFSAGFSERMALVHDSTLSVGLSFRGLTVEAGGKRILTDVSGTIQAGRVTALMGPSGAGKSTLLHALCGKLGRQLRAGEVRVNGSSRSSIRQLKKLVGFVPQDDILLGSLTVKETLRFHASLRLPTHVDEATREEWVDDCIDLLGLTDVKHSVVGSETNRGISGGQKKRVNIGVELVSDPSILFLDEPTSGLDSSAALEVVRCLRSAAQEGMTVVCVIHQPRASVFDLFDDLILLGRSSAKLGGRTVYSGPAARAQAYFAEELGYEFAARENLADVLIDIVSGIHRPATQPAQPHAADQAAEPTQRTGGHAGGRAGGRDLAAAWAEAVANGTAGGQGGALGGGGDRQGAKARPGHGMQSSEVSGLSSFPGRRSEDDTTLGRSGHEMAHEPSVAPLGPDASPDEPSVADPWANERVQLHGLQAAPELNGRLGMVLGPASDATGRYQVRLSAAGGGRPARTLSVKPQNLARLGPLSSIDAQPFGGDRPSLLGSPRVGSPRDLSGPGGLEGGLEEPGEGRPNSLTGRGSDWSVRSSWLGGESFGGIALGPLDGSEVRRAFKTMESAMSGLAVRLKDHQGRRTPSPLFQFRLFFDRQAIQISRDLGAVFKNVVMFAGTGLILGALYKDMLLDWPSSVSPMCNQGKIDCADDDEFKAQLLPEDCAGRIWPSIFHDMDLTYRQVFTLALLGITLLSTQASLDLFGAERLVFWRESRHHSIAMYGLGKTLAYAPLSLLYPLVFTGAFHTLFNPMTSFQDTYWVFLATSLAAEGLGILLSVAFPEARQVAGGVCALGLAMLTGCFPLFEGMGATRVVGYASFLRYSAQLLFRYEYLGYLGWEADALCAHGEADKALDKCLKHSPYYGGAFWLPPDDASLGGPTTFEHCPKPWRLEGAKGSQEPVIAYQDDNLGHEGGGDDEGQWDAQCCGTNLWLKINKTIMRGGYGYHMEPDFSFAKIVGFALLFRFAAIALLCLKDRDRRR